jgi:hypothetical protein
MVEHFTRTVGQGLPQQGLAPQQSPFALRSSSPRARDARVGGLRASGRNRKCGARSEQCIPIERVGVLSLALILLVGGSTADCAPQSDTNYPRGRGQKPQRNWRDRGPIRGLSFGQLGELGFFREGNGTAEGTGSRGSAGQKGT